MQKTTENNPNKQEQPKTTIYKNNYNNNSKKTSQKTLETQNKIFATYQIWLTENAPYCADTENFIQLTAEELYELTIKYSPEKIKETILTIENKKLVRKKEKSLYKILNNFFKQMNKNAYF